MLQPWIVFSILSSLAYFAHDLVLKQVSNKIDGVLASTILNLFAFSSLFVHSIFVQANTWHKFSWMLIESGLIFSNGGYLSLAIPLVICADDFLRSQLPK